MEEIGLKLKITEIFFQLSSPDDIRSDDFFKAWMSNVRIPCQTDRRMSQHANTSKMFYGRHDEVFAAPHTERPTYMGVDLRVGDCYAYDGEICNGKVEHQPVCGGLHPFNFHYHCSDDNVGDKTWHADECAYYC